MDHPPASGPAYEIIGRETERLRLDEFLDAIPRGVRALVYDGDAGRCHLLGADDAIPMGLMPLLEMSAKGRTSSHYSNVDSPQSWANPAEIRAVVTAKPQMPTAVSRESNLVEVAI